MATPDAIKISEEAVVQFTSALSDLEAMVDDDHNFAANRDYWGTLRVNLHSMRNQVDAIMNKLQARLNPVRVVKMETQDAQSAGVKATLIKTDGTREEIILPGDSPARLAKMQELVGGYVEAIHLRGGQTMFVNEEGLLKSLPRNEAATLLMTKAGRPLNNYIVGNVIVAQSKDI